MVRVLLSAAAPFQGLIDQISPTHRFINYQALAILRSDGRHLEADWLHGQLEPFCAGCDWADTGWKNAGHMYHPGSGHGQKGLPNAVQMFREYLDLALRLKADPDQSQCAFYLGAAAHLVQDLCVPHHAAVTLWRGHRAFEDWAARHRQQYATFGGGLYDLAKSPEEWVTVNAEYTLARWSGALSAHLGRPLLEAAVGDLLPRAQRTTAGFVAYFLR